MQQALHFPTVEVTDRKEEIVRQEKMLARGKCVPERVHVMDKIPRMSAQVKTA